jgi:hypothetical protein
MDRVVGAILRPVGLLVLPGRRLRLAGRSGRPGRVKIGTGIGAIVAGLPAKPPAIRRAQLFGSATKFETRIDRQDRRARRFRNRRSTGAPPPRAVWPWSPR